MTPITLTSPQSRVLPRPAHDWPAVTSLLVAARASWQEAAGAARPTERYAAAHLAALRAAAAVLAARAVPTTGTPSTRASRRAVRPRGRPASAWTLLTQVTPELAEWAAFFAAGAPKRAAAEAGINRAVTEREADDLLRDAQIFLGLVEGLLAGEEVRSSSHSQSR